MSHYLVEDALAKVWCAPRQDLPAILALTRVTPRMGVFNDVKILWDRITLPETGSLFHVYQIGHNLPGLLGLSDVSEKWVRLSDVCNNNFFVCDLYLTNGLQFPRTESWMYVTKGQTLIIAVKILPVIASLDDNQLYMRCYSNAFFNSKYYQAGVDGIHIEGGVIATMPQLLTLQQNYINYQAKPLGHCYAFHNGKYVSHFNPSTVVIGDVVEWVWDSTIYKVLEYVIKDLDVFDSVLDSKGKYLVHQPKAGVSYIDYEDDLDVFLYQNNAAGQRVGRYYGRNKGDSIRMVTHCDYSFPVQYLAAYAGADTGWNNITETTLRVHVRRSGYQRQLQFEANKLHELYKLSDSQIQQAMFGLNATLPEWRVANLEQSTYLKLMSADYEDVKLDMVTEAYGYNAMSQIAGYTPQFVETLGENRSVTLPVGLQASSTIYEYDAQGKLLGAVYHSDGAIHVPYYAETVLVEAIYGKGGRTLDAHTGDTTVFVDPGSNYRVYRYTKGYPVGMRDWEDVTGEALYHIAGQVLTITDTSDRYTYRVLSDQQFLSYSFNLTYRDHLLKFSFNWRPDGVSNEVCEIPPGKINLWLNGYALIEGLDYFVKWPQVVICNKRYLNQNDPYTQKVTVRLTGFSDSELNRDALPETGFVKHGMLSVDNQFDLRDDRVVRCVVDGATYHRKELKFAEDTSAVLVPDAREGAPYIVEEVIVPIKGVSDYDTLVLRDEALELDGRISEYLSKYLPEAVNENVVIIDELYHLYSPFMAKILFDILNGVLVIDGTFRSDKTIMEELDGYEYLLDYDPCVKDLDFRFVNVHPHDKTSVVSVNMREWAYMSRVAKLYLKQRIDLSRFVAISEE